MQAVVFTALGPISLFTCLKFRCTQEEHGSKDDNIYPVVQGMAALSIFCIFQVNKGFFIKKNLISSFV